MEPRPLAGCPLLGLSNSLSAQGRGRGWGHLWEDYNQTSEFIRRLKANVVAWETQRGVGDGRGSLTGQQCHVCIDPEAAQHGRRFLVFSEV